MGLLVGREMRNYAKAPDDILGKAKILSAIANEFDIPLGAAALQFPQAHPSIISVIPGPRSETELKEILKWQNTRISSEFWTKLKEKNCSPQRLPHPNKMRFDDQNILNV